MLLDMKLKVSIPGRIAHAASEAIRSLRRPFLTFHCFPRLIWVSIAVGTRFAPDRVLDSPAFVPPLPETMREKKRGAEQRVKRSDIISQQIIIANR